MKKLLSELDMFIDRIRIKRLRKQCEYEIRKIKEAYWLMGRELSQEEIVSIIEWYDEEIQLIYNKRLYKKNTKGD